MKTKMTEIHRCPAYIWCDGPKVVSSPTGPLVLRRARAALVQGGEGNGEASREAVLTRYQEEFGEEPLYFLRREGTTFCAATGALPHEFFPHTGRRVALDS